MNTSRTKLKSRALELLYEDCIDYYNIGTLTMDEFKEKATNTIIFYVLRAARENEYIRQKAIEDDGIIFYLMAFANQAHSPFFDDYYLSCYLQARRQFIDLCKPKGYDELGFPDIPNRTCSECKYLLTYTSQKGVTCLSLESNFVPHKDDDENKDVLLDYAVLCDEFTKGKALHVDDIDSDTFNLYFHIDVSDENMLKRVHDYYGTGTPMDSGHYDEWVMHGD